jgi:hypothetical protein
LGIQHLYGRPVYARSKVLLIAFLFLFVRRFLPLVYASSDFFFSCGSNAASTRHKMAPFLLMLPLGARPPSTLKGFLGQ